MIKKEKIMKIYTIIVDLILVSSVSYVCGAAVRHDCNRYFTNIKDAFDITKDEKKTLKSLKEYITKNPSQFIAQTCRKEGEFEGFTPLTYVASRVAPHDLLIGGKRSKFQDRKMDIFQLLLNNGARLEDTDGFGKMSLHYAVEIQDLRLITLITGTPTFRPHINQKDKEGKTALHYAVEKLAQILDTAKREGYDDTTLIVDLLLMKGAKINIKDNKGLDVQDYAMNAHEKNQVTGILESAVERAKKSGQLPTD